MTILVVTDLDGTVWDRNLRCRPDVVAAIHTLENDRSVELLVATGRRRTSAAVGFDSNGFQLPSILLNGAVGFDFAADHTFHEVCFTSSDLDAALRTLAGHGLAPVVYLSDHRAIAIEAVSTCVEHVRALGSDLLWASVDEVAPRTDVLGMSMLGIEASDAHEVLPDLAALAGVEVAAYADHLYPPYSLMIAPPKVTKALGIEAYIEHRDLRPDRIIAVGDGGNDLEMLAMADVALAVVGGDPRAIELADQVIARPEDGGWTAVLDHLR